MLNLLTIKKAFDNTIKSTLEYSSSGLRSCRYNKRGGFVYSPTNKIRTNYIDFVSMWLPQSIMNIICSKEDISYSYIVKSEPNEKGISKRTYNNEIIDIIYQDEFISELSDHIIKTIHENCINCTFDEFIGLFCKEIISEFKNDTSGTYLQNDYRLSKPSPRLENYITVYDSETWSTDYTVRQISVLSLIALFPNEISEINKEKLTDVAEKSIPNDFKAQLYYKKREQYRHFREKDYQLTIDNISHRISGNNSVVVITAPGGEGKTALASYVFHHFTQPDNKQKYKYVWWLDFSSTIEDAIVNCNDISFLSSNPQDSSDIINCFVDAIIKSNSRERILLIIDNLNRDRNICISSLINFKELIQEPNVDVLITTRLGQEWKNESDWRACIQNTSWINLEKIDSSTAEDIFYYYYGVMRDECNLEEKKSISHLLELSANNIFAIQLLALCGKYYKKGIIQFTNNVLNCGFRYPDSYVNTEHSLFEEKTASEQIATLYDMDLNELDDSTKNLIWYFVLCEEGIWFSENDIIRFFNDNNNGRRRIYNRCWDAETLESLGWLIFDPLKGYIIHDIIRIAFLNRLSINKYNINTPVDYKLSNMICVANAPEGTFKEFVGLITKERDISLNEPVLIPAEEYRKRAIICTSCLKYTKLKNHEVIALMYAIFGLLKYFDANKYIDYYEELAIHIHHFCSLSYSLEINNDDISNCQNLLIDLYLFCAKFHYFKDFSQWNTALAYYDTAVCDILDTPYKQITAKQRQNVRNIVSSDSHLYIRFSKCFLSVMENLPRTHSLVFEDEDRIDAISTTNIYYYFNHINVHLKDHFFDNFQTELMMKHLFSWIVAPKYRVQFISSLENIGIIIFYIEPNKIEIVETFLYQLIDLINSSLAILDSSNPTTADLYNKKDLIYSLLSCKSYVLCLNLYKNIPKNSANLVYLSMEDTLNEAKKMDGCSTFTQLDSQLFHNLCYAKYLMYISDFEAAKNIFIDILSSIDNSYGNWIHEDDYYKFALSIRCKTEIIRCETNKTVKELRYKIELILVEINNSIYKNDFENDLEVINKLLSFPTNFALVGTIYHYAPLEIQEYIAKKYWNINL